MFSRFCYKYDKEKFVEKMDNERLALLFTLMLIVVVKSSIEKEFQINRILPSSISFYDIYLSMGQ